MNIILLSGGIGNQMFQYAFAISSFKPADNVIVSDYIVQREKQHSGLMLASVFDTNIQNNKILNIVIRFFRKVHLLKNRKPWKKVCLFIEKCYSLFSVNLYIEDSILPYRLPTSYMKKKCNILWGYWQSFQYFDDNALEIRRIYKFEINKLSIKSQTILVDIYSKNSVSIHIRRGDYLDKDNKKIFENICTIDYYKQAIEILINAISNPCFYVFSDDILWVKNNLFLPNAIFVNWNTGVDSWQDMCLMSKCKHNIIANSTFSWWGAWLNDNPQKIVVSPKRFTNIAVSDDLIPDEWIKI